MTARSSSRSVTAKFCLMLVEIWGWADTSFGLCSSSAKNYPSRKLEYVSPLTCNIALQGRKWKVFAIHILKKSCIRETPTVSTDADSRTNKKFYEVAWFFCLSFFWKIAWEGDKHTNDNTQTDLTTTRPTRPRGLSLIKCYIITVLNF